MHPVPGRELTDRELSDPRIPADRSKDVHT